MFYAKEISRLNALNSKRPAAPIAVVTDAHRFIDFDIKYDTHEFRINPSEILPIDPRRESNIVVITEGRDSFSKVTLPDFPRGPYGDILPFLESASHQGLSLYIWGINVHSKGPGIDVGQPQIERTRTHYRE